MLRPSKNTIISNIFVPPLSLPLLLRMHLKFFMLFFFAKRLDKLRVVLVSAMGGEAASLEQLHRAIAPEAAAYTDAASVVQDKAKLAAAGLAAVKLKGTMDPRDGRQYDSEYADSMAQR